MSYNTKNLLTDATGHFIPQYYDVGSDQYLPLGNVYDVVLQNSANAIGNGTPLTVGGIKTVTVELTTTTTSSQTTAFEGSSTSGAFYPIQGLRLSDYVIATQSTGLNELWQFDVTGLVSFRTRISALVGIYEVSSLLVSSAPTSSGNVTVNLNGVATNIAVSPGTAEVDTLTVSSGATTGGNITITLNGVAKTVAVATGDSAGAIGDKIRATTFTGWTVGGTSGSNTVTFTNQTIGVVSAPSYSDTGTTGTAASFTRTTTGSVADATTDVANRIRNTSFNGWTTGGTGTTVTFTSTTDGVKTDSTYSANSTGTTGTMTTTTQGSSASLSVKGKGIAQ